MRTPKELTAILARESITSTDCMKAWIATAIVDGQEQGHSIDKIKEMLKQSIDINFHIYANTMAEEKPELKVIK